MSDEKEYGFEELLGPEGKESLDLRQTDVPYELLEPDNGPKPWDGELDDPEE